MPCNWGIIPHMFRSANLKRVMPADRHVSYPTDSSTTIRRGLCSSLQLHWMQTRMAEHRGYTVITHCWSLTHWDLDERRNIFQTTFSNALFWKMFQFLPKFSLKFFLWHNLQCVTFVRHWTGDNHCMKTGWPSSLTHICVIRSFGLKYRFTTWNCLIIIKDYCVPYIQKIWRFSILK